MNKIHGSSFSTFGYSFQMDYKISGFKLLQSSLDALKVWKLVNSSLDINHDTDKILGQRMPADCCKRAVTMCRVFERQAADDIHRVPSKQSM